MEIFRYCCRHALDAHPEVIRANKSHTPAFQVCTGFLCCSPYLKKRMLFVACAMRNNDGHGAGWCGDMFAVFKTGLLM